MKKKVLIFSFIVLLSGGVGFAYLQRNEEYKTSDNQLQNSDKNNSAESEGHTFKVPSNVDDDRIKNWQLITENEQFKIRYDGDKYLVTLYAIINNPDQYDSYRDQLREFKANALDYMKSKKIDINSSKIVYEPEEANDL